MKHQIKPTNKHRKQRIVNIVVVIPLHKPGARPARRSARRGGCAADLTDEIGTPDPN